MEKVEGFFSVPLTELDDDDYDELFILLLVPRDPSRHQGPIVLGTAQIHSERPSQPWRAYSWNGIFKRAKVTKEHKTYWKAMGLVHLSHSNFWKFHPKCENNSTERSYLPRVTYQVCDRVDSRQGLWQVKVLPERRLQWCRVSAL